MTPRAYPDRRINRQTTPLRQIGVPVASVMLASLAPLLPIVSSAPVLPPFGLLFLLAWRLLRPGLWPVWAGAPLGLFDDLISGQPIGSAVLVWSLALIFLDLVEQRLVWRNLWQDWLLAALCIIGVLAGGLAINNRLSGNAPLAILFPQMILSVSLYPVVLRLVARLDRVRLNR